MKNIPNNQLCFKISQKNHEPPLDSFYMFEKKHPSLQSYIKSTQNIKNCLISIKTLTEKGADKKSIDFCYNSLAKALDKYANCSEFSCFINACDNVLDYVKSDVSLLKEITKRYLKYRNLNENAPEEWIQAILDSNSGRKKGNCGENKLINILQNKNFKKVSTWEDFNKEKKCVAKFSKVFNLVKVRENLNVNIKTKKQNKRLDLIIKDNKKFFILEAKHLNTNGGGQDKQISELIEILSLNEENKDIYFVSFLDGNYSNLLLGTEERGDKVAKQRSEIIKYLSKNKNNYWVNTAGFKKIFS